ncbi:hypothetical protein SeSz3_117 [Salmonella phage SenASZ3]|uniref:Alpha hydrolase n=1 Tax=Salmonella phage SenASZ3 TaxID=2301648 RepID=A0A385ITR2_9CAUD|nr:QueC-like queuosine biosynthesis [Salmonella phage SenASZ3]AXY86508.1 hypothetical protein SeSz3_117 [Salmonella phage SenASZ3]
MEIVVSVSDCDFVYRVLQGDAPLPENNQEVTLVWSGGVDSTYMLIWLLSKGYSVHTVYCHLENNKFKSKRENWARNKIHNWINKNAPLLMYRWTHHQEPISSINVPNGGFRACLAQAPIWLLNTQFKGSGLPSTYILAYVNGDDAIHWIPAFNKVIEGYNMMTRDGERPIEILYPLISLKKSWFYHHMSPIHDLMTWCELPILKKNCDCPACVRHRHELS